MLLKIITLLAAALSTVLSSSHDSDYCKDRINEECEEHVKDQCYFDKERTCFKHFDTNCDMELAACKYGKVYEAWPEKFCESVQFMCHEELDVYSWPPEYFYQQIVHIRDNATNQYEGMF